MTTLVALGWATACDDSRHTGGDGAGNAYGDGGAYHQADFCPPDAGAGTQDAWGSTSAGSDTVIMKLQKIGKPNWEPVCAHMFAGQCGGKADGYSKAPETVLKVTPKHQHFKTQNVIGPKISHKGDYSTELSGGIAAAGLTSKRVFKAAELKAPSCLFAMLMLVPDQSAPSGSSPDYTSGLVLPASAFPLLLDGNLLANGKLVATSFDSLYPALSKLTPPVNGSSYSHVPLSFFFNDGFVPAAAGSYQLRLKITDAGKNGWNVIIQFTVS